MNAILFPRATSRKRSGSNRGRSQPSGCHRQKRCPGSLPYLWQFLKSGSVGHVRFVYTGPRGSLTHFPTDMSHFSSSSKHSTPSNN